MPRICYVERNFKAPSLAVIQVANDIIREYQDQGFDLTLRQLYYQFVSRDLLANKLSEYKRLGSIVNDARLAGLIDWDTIIDRTRRLEENSHWRSPRGIIERCAEQYAIDKWGSQEYRPEVWIEKDALIGVIEGVCQDLDIPYFACRGYSSQSAMWRAAQRLAAHRAAGQTPFIIHLGDHDPSGIDMSRDIRDRIYMFAADIEFERIALNMDQVEHFSPPPNPAKETDSRCDGYIAKFGNESWELDALEPKVITKLIDMTVKGIRDEDAWTAACQEEAEGRQQLEDVAYEMAANEDDHE